MNDIQILMRLSFYLSATETEDDQMKSFASKKT